MNPVEIDFLFVTSSIMLASVTWISFLVEIMCEIMWESSRSCSMRITDRRFPTTRHDVHSWLLSLVRNNLLCTYIINCSFISLVKHVSEVLLSDYHHSFFPMFSTRNRRCTCTMITDNTDDNTVRQMSIIARFKLQWSASTYYFKLYIRQSSRRIGISEMGEYLGDAVVGSSTRMIEEKERAVQLTMRGDGQFLNSDARSVARMHIEFDGLSYSVCSSKGKYAKLARETKLKFYSLWCEKWATAKYEKDDWS